jgi:glycosyltransferase involved in cell wall biosynthesis
VALLDGDDIWHPDKIATQIAALEAFPAVGLLFSDFIGFDDKTGANRRGTVNRYAADDTRPAAPLLHPWRSDPAVLRGAEPWRHRCRGSVRRGKMPFNEDAEYWLRVAAVAPLHHQPLALVRKREWYGSLGSAKYALENLACKREITQRMLRRVPDLAPAADAREARIAYKTAVHFLTSGDRARARRHLRLCLTLDPRFAKAGAALASVLPALRPAAALARRADHLVAQAAGFALMLRPKARKLRPTTDRPLRVVHVMTSVLAGGAEENTFATCRGQIARGHDVWVIHGRSVDPPTLACAPKGARLLHEPKLHREISPAADLAALRALTRTMRRIAPDVVHTHQSKAGIIGRMAGWRARVPVILHSVHILPFLNVPRGRRMLYLGLERLVAPVTDAYISVAKGMRDANLAAGLGTPARNFTVYSGMPLERFRSACPPPDAPNGPMIALVGALEPRKRHAAFLDVFAGLAGRHPGLGLYLFGKGTGEAALRARVQALDLQDRVHFMGFRQDVERWLAAADLCVLPSMREGLPRVVVQYVAAGKPVVVTHLEGIEEIVEDGVNGYVVGRDDFVGMGHAIGRVLDDPALAAGMAEAARTRDLSRWSEALMEPAIDRILQEVIARKAHVPNSGRRTVALPRSEAGASGSRIDATLFQRH